MHNYAPPKLPIARCSSFTEEKHGITLKDPYRWMENGDSTETQEYIEQHNKYFDAYLQSSDLQSFANDVSSCFPKKTYGAPRQYGEYYWWQVEDHEKDQTYIVRSRDYKNIDPEIHIKTESFGAHKSCEFWGSDPKGQLWIGAVQTNGSDWQSIHIYDADTKTFSDEVLENCKFTFKFVFTKDRKGFFYHQLPSTENDSNGAYGQLRLYYHFLGTCQSDDIEIPLDSNLPIEEAVTDDGKYVVIINGEGTNPNYKVYYAEISKLLHGDFELIAIDDSASWSYRYLCSLQGKWLFLTNKGFSNQCVVSWDKTSGFENLVPGSKDVLKSASPIGDNCLLLVYMHNASDKLCIWNNQDDTLAEVPGVDFCSIKALSSSEESSVAFVEVETYRNPTSIYKVELKSLQLVLIRGSFGQDEDFVTKRVTYLSEDATEIGMFISYFKSLQRSKNPPVLLYAYGGFNVSEEPRHQPFWVAFMRRFGGVLCVANIRGGGECGNSWWESARGTKRQVGFDDFKAAARYIVASGLTTAEKIVASGVSNGGLLVSACTQQNPELFGIVICDVGIHDLPRFDQFTFGFLWRGEYGDPRRKEDFEVLLKLSPYANVKSQKLPALMYTTADNDDRVVPAHSLKMVASVLHENPRNAKPIVLRIFKGTGHMAGKTTRMVVEESSQKLAFISLQLEGKAANTSHGLVSSLLYAIIHKIAGFWTRRGQKREEFDEKRYHEKLGS